MQNTKTCVGYRDFYLSFRNDPGRQICFNHKLKQLGTYKSIQKIDREFGDVFVDDAKNLQFRRPAKCADKIYGFTPN